MLPIVILISSIAAGSIQTATGFGAGVLLLLILPHFFDMLAAPALSSSICIALSATLAIRNRKHIKARIILLPTLIYTSFSILFVQFAKKLDLKVLTIVFGVFLITLSIYYLCFQRKARIRQSLTSAVFSSSISGIFGGLFAIGGPLIALYLLDATETWEEYLGNLQLLFVTTTVCSLVARIANGLYTVDLIPYTILGAVGVSIGRLIGTKLTDTLRLESSKRIIYCCVGLSGVVTILKQLIY